MATRKDTDASVQEHKCRINRTGSYYTNVEQASSKVGSLHNIQNLGELNSKAGNYQISRVNNISTRQIEKEASQATETTKVTANDIKTIQTAESKHTNKQVQFSFQALMAKQITVSPTQLLLELQNKEIEEQISRVTDSLVEMRVLASEAKMGYEDLIKVKQDQVTAYERRFTAEIESLNQQLERESAQFNSFHSSLQHKGKPK